MKRGFTLIEVLVALAIIAIALIGVVKLTGATADNTRALEQRLHARWLAQNQLALARATRGWPEPGATTTTGRMSGEEFAVKLTVSATPNPNFRKLEVEVMHLDGAPSFVTLNTLLLRPGL